MHLVEDFNLVGLAGHYLLDQNNLKLSHVIDVFVDMVQKVMPCVARDDLRAKL
jgi:hypothetical protein